MDANVFWWLLTALSAPAFVRLYVEPFDNPPVGMRKRASKRWPLRVYEAAFFALHPSSTHSEDQRKEAWRELQRAAVRSGSAFTPAEFFTVAGLKVLDTWEAVAPKHPREYREAASRSGMLDLFPRHTPAETSLTMDREMDREMDGYVEVHAHLNGCVPYEWLWHRWMKGELLRPAVNLNYPIERSAPGVHLGMGPWKRTYSELLAIAASCLQNLKRVRMGPPRTSVPPDLVAYFAVYYGIHRSIIYDRGVSGLSRFTNSFSEVGKLFKARSTPQRNLLREQVKETLRKFREEGAVAVELRTNLPGRKGSLREKLDDLILGYLEHLQDVGDEPLPRFGIIFSLKRTDFSCESGNSALACEHQLKVLVQLLGKPLYRYFVLGIDAAGQEQGCPPRALQKPIAQVHTYNKGKTAERLVPKKEICEIKDCFRKGGLDSVARYLERLRLKPVRLGITIHAGEDFLDPMTGLRHIWETVEQLDLKKKDRIGHALAVGLKKDAVKELLKNRASHAHESHIQQVKTIWRIHKPRGVHLLDLAWERNQYSSDEESTAQKRRLVEEMLRSVAYFSHGSPTNISRLLDGIQKAGHPVALLLPALHFGNPADVEPEDREWVMIDEDWLNRFEEMRLKVIHLLKERMIAVESCPTSNQRIGNLKEPPLEELRKKLPEQTLIATDDPGLFDSWPQHELEQVPEYGDALLANNRRFSFIRY